MTGLFGGLLWLLEALGRLFFAALVGWRQADKAAWQACAAVGGGLCGGIVGAAIALFSSSLDAGDLVGFTVLGSLAGAMFGLLLAGLEYALQERSNPK